MNEQEQLLWNAIQKADRILLHLHPKPDMDSVGSALALYHALTAIGKHPTVIAGDSAGIEYGAILPGMEHIVNKSFGDIVVNGFDLFIIVDSAAPIMISRMATPVFPLAIPTIVIDHHPSNSGFGDINYIQPDAVSTTAVLYSLFQLWNISITSDIALCLLAGLYTDSGAFSYEKTTPETLHIAHTLALITPDFYRLFDQLRLPEISEQDLVMQGVLLNHMELLLDGVGIAVASYDHCTQANINMNIVGDTGLSTIMRTVKGWNIGITLIERKPEVISVSMRAREQDWCDLSSVAEQLGGGGHRLAAGAVLHCSLEEAKERVKKALVAVHPKVF